MKEDHISSLEDIVVELHSSMEEMESHLCHCADKEKGRELEEGEVEDLTIDDILEYASNEEYCTPPMGVLQELHLIEDIPDCSTPSNSCSCSKEEATGVLDNEQETIVENKVPIPI